MKSKRLLIAAAATLILAAGPTFAQDQGQQAEAPAPQNKTDAPQVEGAGPQSKATATQTQSDVSLELNKLEPSDKGCRAYLVVSNTGSKAYDAYRLELVMFRPDGVIGRTFSLNLAPLRPEKRTVKRFNLNDTSCDEIGSLFVNDVLECRAESGPVDNCLANLKVSTLSKVELTK